MDSMTIAIIGTGHIGRAIFKGLINSSIIRPSQIILTNHHPEKIDDLHKQYGVQITSDNQKAAEKSDIVLFCVKPRDMKQALYKVRKHLDRHKLIISVAACINLNLLETYLGNKNYQIIRIIPNIPVAYGEGVIGWIDNGKIKKENLLNFKKSFSRLGLLVQCSNDNGLEKLSLIAGCGIGYVAYFMKNLVLAAEKYEFSKEIAQKISQAVFSGTVHHLTTTGQTPDELITSVATKGGITEEVLNSLDKSKFVELFLQSIGNGFKRVGIITNELKKEV